MSHDTSGLPSHRNPPFVMASSGLLLKIRENGPYPPARPHRTVTRAASPAPRAPDFPRPPQTGLAQLDRQPRQPARVARVVDQGTALPAVPQAKRFHQTAADEPRRPGHEDAPLRVAG